MQKKSLVLLFVVITAVFVFGGCLASADKAEYSPALIRDSNIKYSKAQSEKLMLSEAEAKPEEMGNRDDFMKYEVAGFNSVLEHPNSTFSTDVDSAMYTYCKKMIERGQLPESDSVRVEEFLNYFNYEYPAPKDSVFAMYSELTENPFNGGETALLRVALKAKEITNEQRRPAHLTFLIDVSGSMQATDKLGLVKESMKILVSHLKDGDTVGMCTYASGAEIILEPTRDKDEIIDALDKLEAGGSTAGAAGLTNAYDLANEVFVKGEINRVIMCTDGDFNVGITDPKKLEKIINEKSQKGISLSIFGFGSGNLHDGRMKHMSKNGNGNYYYIGNKKDAQRIVGDKLASTLEIVSSNVKIQLEFNPAYVDEYRLIGYEIRALKDEDFNNDLVDAGDIGPGHNVTAVYELKLHREEDENIKEPKELAGKLGIFKIRYKHNITDSESYPLNYYVEKTIKSFESADPSFKFAVGVTGFADVLRNSQYAKDWRLTTAIDCIKAGRVVPESDGKELIELIRKVISLKDKAPDSEDNVAE